MSLSYVQSNTLYQAGSGNIIGATSIVLTSLTDIYGNVLTMASFGAIGYITLEPDTTNEEAAIFTGITANTNGTYTLTGVSTILAQTPYTATSGLVRQHSGGTKVVITDNVAFWATFGNLQNANEWTQTQTFDVPPISAIDPTTSSEVANKHYVDNVAVAGAPNASPTVKGIVQEATQAQVLAKTAAGSTGADLYVNPSTLASTLLSDYKVDTGSANAYVITPSPAITAYTTGQIFSFKAVSANTGASTLSVNGLGTKNIYKLGGTALVSGDIGAGQIILVEYDGTEFQMLNPVANVPVTPPPVTDIQTFTSTGANTWTMPTGAKKILVQMWGAGGSGGVSSNIDSAGGGGGGEYWEQWFASSDLTSTVTVTIGVGGLGVPNNNQGNPGGNTTFGSYATAYGGAGGPANSSNPVSGGGGGSPANVGDIAGFWGVGASGANGGYGLFSGAGGGSSSGNGGGSYYGGAGGGGATGGTGGTSVYGGNGGAGHSGSTTGGAGAVPGGGGGSSASGTSGAGGAGKAIITTFF